MPLIWHHWPSALSQHSQTLHDFQNSAHISHSVCIPACFNFYCCAVTSHQCKCNSARNLPERFYNWHQQRQTTAPHVWRVQLGSAQGRRQETKKITTETAREKGQFGQNWNVTFCFSFLKLPNLARHLNCFAQLAGAKKKKEQRFHLASSLYLLYCRRPWPQ